MSPNELCKINLANSKIERLDAIRAYLYFQKSLVSHLFCTLLDEEQIKTK